METKCSISETEYYMALLDNLERAECSPTGIMSSEYYQILEKLKAINDNLNIPPPVKNEDDKNSLYMAKMIAKAIRNSV